MPRFRTVEVSDPALEQEGLRQVTVHSRNLRGRGDLTVWRPSQAVPSRPLPLVVLLHGVYGSHWGWTAKGGVHRTAARLIASGAIPPMALAMPSDGLRNDGTGYLDGPDGDFERWILDDVPAAAAEAVPEVDPEAPLLLSGLSMGGFGTLRIGARHPGRFLALSAHSAVTGLADLRPFIETPMATPADGDGPEVAPLLLREAGRLPPLRFDCGVDDPLAESNRSLHRTLEAAGVPHVYEEFPGGHAWPYWAEHVADTLRFFGNRVAERTANPGGRH